MEKTTSNWARGRRGRGEVRAEVDKGPGFGLGAGKDGEGVIGGDRWEHMDRPITLCRSTPREVVEGVKGSVVATAVAWTWCG
ncbi:hypothetical protein Syun_029319 [Stephania yunnanensis]|uniref:Uncharacterized protein n=1 Tax=Stephania yunnanensis TaxID=152371 RepID=A0AAP0HL96_9MAGN